ncbi:Cell division protein FtsK [hydrothermal vent metagenome]|uniref:Cell division protein FtsK n=1 Tax=hydrothermal vent metagenome TaxID=652676 RepID=A0A1W1C2H0_9ZZZZ
MKDTCYIILFGLFIYCGFSTIFGDSGLIGSYGAVFALYNKFYFGYVAYIWPFLALVPLYFFYKGIRFDFRTAEITVASFLSLYSFLLGQALLIDGSLRGKFGGDFVDFLSPYIGIFGLWIFWFIITSISIIIFAEKNSSQLLSLSLSLVKGRTANLELPQREKKREIKTIVAQEEPIEIEEKTQNITPAKSEIIMQEEIERSTSLDEDIKKEQKEQQKEKIEKTTPKSDKSAKDVDESKGKKGTLIVQELEENKKLLADIEKGEVLKPKNFELPSIEFLQKPKVNAHTIDESELDDKIRYLIDKLAHFRIDGDVVRTYAGPVVSTFEFKPAANVKVSKILNLQDDLAMALSAETIRIQAPIPGKDVVGIEIPNESVDTIYLRELLDDKLFKDSSSPLTIALGKDIVGKPFVTDLKKLPHLLIAGTTGSGKSVGINAMILSLLYKNSPDQLRLLMIDPKMLEFSIYNDIPHLLTPVITKPKQAIAALNNMVAEMERRYELMADSRTKNIENYNEKVKKIGGEHFPYIVVIIDELADLMMTSGKDVEISIARLAQKSRACGIHLIVATQRPSVDVVTGLIKANLPSRISYRVGQKIDSKIILDQVGAESLLGRGDMLFTPPGATGLVRLHAPWTTEEEIENIVEFIKSQREANYDKSFLVEESDNNSASNESYEELDPLFEEAKNVILTDKKTSISYLQRKLQIGYNRSARVIEQLEQEGVLSAPNAKGMREIL